ncbi:MAG: methyltransferase domain-containing protein [Proteobacteria bacterium]|nr:methyltransferase domain-containing protein [Pseudomonadota bacterium]
MQSTLRAPPDLARPETAELYDELPLWSAMFGLMLLEHVPLRPGMRVLDLGCGTGFPAIELAQRLGASGSVAGLDPWGHALERARRKARWYEVDNLELIEGDAGAMPFAEGVFDLITSNLGLNNFADPAAALVECRRVLRKSGRLALTTNLEGHMREFYRVFAESLRALGLGAALPVLERHIAGRATIPAIRTLFDGGGFRLVRVVEAERPMRFLDGSALLGHYFIRLGFLPSWRAIVDPGREAEVFRRLEADLNRHAQASGVLELSIPMAYVEAARQ